MLVSFLNPVPLHLVASHPPGSLEPGVMWLCTSVIKCMLSRTQWKINCLHPYWRCPSRRSLRGWISGGFTKRTLFTITRAGEHTKSLNMQVQKYEIWMWSKSWGTREPLNLTTSEACLVVVCRVVVLYHMGCVPRVVKPILSGRMPLSPCGKSSP